LFDDQPDNFLAGVHIEALSGFFELRKEVFHRGAQRDEATVLDRLQANSLEFLFQRGLPAPQFGHTAAQVLQPHQFLLVSIQQFIQPDLHPFDLFFQSLLALLRWIATEVLRLAPLDLILHHFRII
jgi:hypothetical protein